MTKFIFSWLSVSGLMFGISYLWHGVILNDIANLQYPLSWYLGYSVLAYLLIGGILAFGLSHLFQRLNPGKGFLLGALVGFSIYFLVFVLGLSFRQTNVEHLLLDFSWQMVEQGLGGGFIVVFHLIVQRIAERT